MGELINSLQNFARDKVNSVDYRIYLYFKILHNSLYLVFYTFQLSKCDHI